MNRPPLPGFSDPATFVRAPRVAIDDVQPGQFVVVGVPQDSTAASRPGARWGPAAIRSASVGLDYWLRSTLDEQLVNVESGRAYRYRSDQVVVDAGDLMTYPLDAERTIESVSAAVSSIVRRGGIPVALGGDHFVSYPVCKGVCDGLGEARAARVGYVHIDGDLDISDDNKTWGRYFHGTNARRISELPAVSPPNMAMFGIFGTTRRDQWDFVNATGITMLTLGDIRRLGIREAIDRCIDVASSGTDGVYVTCDIDVVDGSHAPGTGAVKLDGMTPGELMIAAETLAAHLPILVGIDLVEVAPNWDPMGRTAVLAADFLTTVLGPRMFEFESLSRDPLRGV